MNIGEVKRADELGYRGQGSRKYLWQACSKCGKERWVALRGKIPLSVMCRECARALGSQALKGRCGDKSVNWKGGQRRHDGYIQIKLQPADFFYLMARQNGYVYEHRLVMAKYLNRRLLAWEIVHHKNGIRDDNRLENLELMSPQKSHLIDTHTKSYIKMLEKRVELLETQIKEIKDGCG